MPSDVTEDDVPRERDEDEELPLPEELIQAAEVALGPEVVICECFPRDGLRHEPAMVPTDEKAAIIARIVECGFRRIEITSLSDFKDIPQFADAEALLAAVPPSPEVLFKAVCPHPDALRRALAARERGRGPEEISLHVSATDAHSRATLGVDRAAQWEAVRAMVRDGADSFVLVGTIAAAFDCPFEGPTDPERVREDAERFMELGVEHITIGDTQGSATPPRVRDLVGWLHGSVPTATLIAHFRDSRGTGLVNCLAAYEAGLRHFDTTLGSCGGDPAGLAHGENFAGNTGTEDFVTLLHAMGVSTGIDLGKLRETGRAAEALLGRRLFSRTARLES